MIRRCILRFGQSSLHGFCRNVPTDKRTSVAGRAKSERAWASWQEGVSKRALFSRPGQRGGGELEEFSGKETAIGSSKQIEWLIKMIYVTRGGDDED